MKWCWVCGREVETRYIDLYVAGSEGLEEYRLWRPLAEYSGKFGIALKPEKEGEPC